jgi:hypothetical protein
VCVDCLTQQQLCVFCLCCLFAMQFVCELATIQSGNKCLKEGDNKTQQQQNTDSIDSIQFNSIDSMQCNAVNAKNASKQHQMTEQASKQASLQFSHSTPLSKCVFCAVCAKSFVSRDGPHRTEEKASHEMFVCLCFSQQMCSVHQSKQANVLALTD